MNRPAGPFFFGRGTFSGNPCLGGTGVPVRLRRGLPGAAALVAVPVQGLRGRRPPMALTDNRVSPVAARCAAARQAWP